MKVKSDEGQEWQWMRVMLVKIDDGQEWRWSILTLVNSDIGQEWQEERLARGKSDNDEFRESRVKTEKRRVRENTEHTTNN